VTRYHSRPRLAERRDSAPVDDWRDAALCRDYDPEWWFPVGHTGPALAQVEEAKQVCRRCPVIDECLDLAIRTGAVGVWGGTTEDERRAA
jgi:WhiB family redox-sensing transcriptional regulator